MPGSGVLISRCQFDRYAPRLEPEFLGAAQHFRHANVVAETMANLLGIGADAVEAQQQHQSSKPGLRRSRVCQSPQIARRHYFDL